MIEKIKEAISKKHSLQEVKGIFFSCFDANNTLIVSSGVAVTDKPLDKVIEMIYHGLIESHQNIQHIICDVIEELIPASSMEEIMAIDIHQYWFCITTTDHSKSGIILPSTAGIQNASEALSLLKEKHKLSGNIIIYKFVTTRLLIS